MLSMLAMSVGAQNIKVEGPTAVYTGEQFQLRYVVNTTDVKGFRMGNVPDAFEVLMGPSTSTQQSFSMINGKTSHTSSVTYTYILMAKKAGTFVIPSAHAQVAGSNVASQAIKINVTNNPRPNPNAQGQPQQQQRSPARVNRAGTRITGNDLFIRASANKSHVYEQEPILLTYKVYTQVELTQLRGEMPDLKGFHTQEIPLPQQKRFHVENVNGKPYNCVTWSQYVMFPQMSGKLEIPSITFKGIVLQEDPNVDPFEAFFNGGSGYVEVSKDIVAPSISIKVDPLPQKPAGFSGGVGKFSVEASLDKEQVSAGDPVTLRFVVKGAGNMKLIKEPTLDLPKVFEKYDAKVIDKTSLTTDGVAGSMTYDILLVPRTEGSYTIPGIKFVYFDTQSSSYKTLTTSPMSLTVTKGKGSGSAADYSQRNDKDIHDFMVGGNEAENPEKTFFGSTGYLMLNGAVLAVFIILLIIFRHRAMELADVTAYRGKKANKVATKRLKKAKKLLKIGKANDFYDEVLRALWGYVGDKLAMPVEQLSRQNISEKLSQRGVSEETIAKFIEALDECEFARYAPGDPAVAMENTYNKAVEAIENIEESKKK
jgi:hypothetical protein